MKGARWQLVRPIQLDFFVLTINLETLNGNPFRGTLTQLEAKYSIYKESLKLDLSNFDGVRVGYKNGPMMVFKLKDAINVDELLPLQQFNLKEKPEKINLAKWGKTQKC